MEDEKWTYSENLFFVVGYQLLKFQGHENLAAVIGVPGERQK